MMRRRGSVVPCSLLMLAYALSLHATASAQAPRAASAPATTQPVDPVALVKAAEQARIEAMNRAARSVVAVMEETGAGGGSGVVVTPDGFGITNFHVVAPLLKTREGEGGMADGRLYPLQVLGVDPTGDVAMFKLEGIAAAAASRPAAAPFVPAVMGDSDAVRLADPVFAMGNPFLLAEDYTPTTTFGLVSGIHRYQFGATGRTLVYTDCIQTDASINPGNSGGPLFDLQGRLIGINGRASFEQRGRINVGLAYAISINQVKRFIPGLRAGLLTEHGTLEATTVDLGYRRVVVEKMLEPSVASAVGMRVGDRIVSFGGREIHSANQFLNILGVYPAGWPVRVVYERDGTSMERIVRLARVPVDVPWEPDADLMRDETRRILTATHAAFTGPKDRSLQWKSALQSAELGMRVCTATESADGQGLRQYTKANGEAVGQVRYSVRTAQTLGPGGAWSDADAIETARANLWLAGRQALYALADEAEYQKWKVVGGDEYAGRVVDLLEYTSLGTPLRVAIDPERHLPVRFYWQRPDTGVSSVAVEIELDKFTVADKSILPREIRTYVGGQLDSMETITSFKWEAP